VLPTSAPPPRGSQEQPILSSDALAICGPVEASKPLLPHHVCALRCPPPRCLLQFQAIRLVRSRIHLSTVGISLGARLFNLTVPHASIRWAQDVEGAML